MVFSSLDFIFKFFPIILNYWIGRQIGRNRKEGGKLLTGNVSPDTMHCE